MILNRKVTIKVNSRNFHHYSQFINEIKNNVNYEIDISNILHTSHQKIDVKCDVCESISYKPYRDYIRSFNNKGFYCCSPKCAQIKNKQTNLEKYGFENTFQVDDFKEKIKETNLEKYGVEYPSQSSDIQEKSKVTSLLNYGVEWASKSPEVKSKIKQTCIKNYGTDYYASSLHAKNRRIKNNKQVPDDMKTEFELYTKIVRNKTNRVKDKLFESWNGLDYYDSENIKNNLKHKHFDKRYPTIDHKISIYFGFINKIDPEIIGDLNNLCITKRSINSSKHVKCL